jgi:hypothetical protein
MQYNQSNTGKERSLYAGDKRFESPAGAGGEGQFNGGIKDEL